MVKKLKWIDKDVLYHLCEYIIVGLKKKSENIERELHKNIIDPFSAIFEASFHNVSLQEWIGFEKTRQIQKSFQNTIGEFHQKVLGNIDGFEDLKTGGVVDIACKEKKIIAEIKNKFNTTKGNHKVAIYDDLENLINKNYKGYTGYYVAVLCKKKINNAFTPSDNNTSSRRIVNEKIREVDGATFYEIATGDKNAIYDIYNILPEILSEITNSNKDKIKKDPLFQELFEKAFK